MNAIRIHEYGERAELGGKYLFIQPNAPALDQLAAMLGSGKAGSSICPQFALENIAKAHALSETGHAVGKIAIYVGQP